MRPGQNYRIGEYALASRLSFFLWGSGPDDELLKLAATRTAAAARRARAAGAADAGGSRGPRRSRTRFASQWLRLQDLEKLSPDCAAVSPVRPHPRRGDASARPSCSSTPSCAKTAPCSSCSRPTTRSSTSASRKHYGIAERHRTASSGASRLPIPKRRGMLGQGSILDADVGGGPHLAGAARQVDHGSAARLAAAAAAAQRARRSKRRWPRRRAARLLSVRERMEQHRANPACSSCHRVIDPLGLALENFDVDRRVAHPGRRRADRRGRRAL